MENTTLTELLLSNKTTNKNYGGVFSCDSLPTKKVLKNKYYIVNTERINSTRVGHWVVLYFRADSCEFFDPLANKIQEYNKLIVDFMRKNCSGKLSYSTVQIQANSSDKCGQFCLFFCYMRCEGESFEHILGYFEAHNLLKNDSIIERLYRGLVKFKNPFMCYADCQK